MLRDRSPAQLLTLLIGATFILVGILGFIPGVTSHLYGGLDFAGHNSQAKLFHVFQVSWLHNIVHIAFGLAGLAFAVGMVSGSQKVLGAVDPEGDRLSYGVCGQRPPYTSFDIVGVNIPALHNYYVLYSPQDE